MQFKTQDLLDSEVIWEAIEDKIVDTSRWSELHQIVFEKDGKFWKTSYSCGLTEQQDESPWEFEDEVTCIEVEEKEVLVKKWVTYEPDK